MAAGWRPSAARHRQSSHGCRPGWRPPEWDVLVAAHAKADRRSDSTQATKRSRYSGTSKDVGRHHGVGDGREGTAAAPVKPACSRVAARTALTIMNSAFRMLLAAMMRARCWPGCALDQNTWARYRGRRTGSASRNRSSITRQYAGCVRKAPRAMHPKAAGRARQSTGHQHTLMPIAPAAPGRSR